MKWDQIETKWAEMTRRVQPKCTARAKDGATSGKSPQGGIAGKAKPRRRSGAAVVATELKSADDRLTAE